MLHSKCCCFPLPTQFFHYAPGSCNSNREKHKGGAGRVLQPPAGPWGQPSGQGQQSLQPAGKGVLLFIGFNHCFLFSSPPHTHFVSLHQHCAEEPSPCLQGLPTEREWRENSFGNMFWNPLIKPIMLQHQISFHIPLLPLRPALTYFQLFGKKKINK